MNKENGPSDRRQQCVRLISLISRLITAWWFAWSKAVWHFLQERETWLALNTCVVMCFVHNVTWSRVVVYTWLFSLT